MGYHTAIAIAMTLEKIEKHLGQLVLTLKDIQTRKIQQENNG